MTTPTTRASTGKVPHLTLRGLRKSYGDIPIIRQCDLTIEEGEFVVLVGPSGCGKSTLLRCIAGLEPISQGSLAIDGRDMTRTPPAERGVAMVFQSYALYPHMTVAENLGFGLMIAGQAPAQIAMRVQEIARLLKLEPLLARKPKALSGGQRQRVAIGRALARQPRIFLFDEPLSNLDAALRGEMRVELARLHAELGSTMIYVTHDQVEAMTLARRIVIMQAGVIEQVGTPLELYNHPVNRFVASFLGHPPMNFLPLDAPGRVSADGTVRLAGGEHIPVAPEATFSHEVAIELGIRPEDLTLCGPDSGGFAARIEVIEQLGSETVLHAVLPGGVPIVARVPGQSGLAPQESVWLRANPQRTLRFDAAGRNLASPPPDLAAAA